VRAPARGLRSAAAQRGGRIGVRAQPLRHLSLSSSFVLGAGINAPFGLATDYDDTWAGRYYALRSDIKAVNANLAAAFQVQRRPFGGRWRQLPVDQGRADSSCRLRHPLHGWGFIGLPSATFSCGLGAGFSHPGSPNDGKADVTATGHAWGYNAGILSQLGGTRVGLAYRSKMKYKLDGTFDITAPANVPARS